MSNERDIEELSPDTLCRERITVLEAEVRSLKGEGRLVTESVRQLREALKAAEEDFGRIRDAIVAVYSPRFGRGSERTYW